MATTSPSSSPAPNPRSPSPASPSADDTPNTPLLDAFPSSTPTPVRCVSLNILPSSHRDERESNDEISINIPLSPPKLFAAKSTPVYSSLTRLQRKELTVDDISAHRIRKSMIHSGQQVLSSRMLKKIAQESDTETIETPTTTKEIEEPTPDSTSPEPKEEKTDAPLSLSELIDIIVNEKEVIPFPPPGSDQKGADTKDDSHRDLRCCSCYDDLVLTKSPDSDASLAVYICKAPDCPGALCDNCLLRQVDITISNALYAVPKIRCPGTCSGRIPTALWRGVLQGMRLPTSTDDSLKKSKSELIEAVVTAYDTLSRNFEQSYLDELSALFDSIVEALSSCNLTLIDVYNQAYQLNIIPPPESPDAAEQSTPKINSFSDFASAVFPLAPEPVFHSSSLFRTNRLTDQLDAYIQGDIANLAGQSETPELDPSLCQTIFCFFLAELAVCLRYRNRVESFVESYEGPSKNSAESHLIKKYSDNAEGLMAMRCGSCHRTTGLNYSEKNNRAIMKTETERRNTLNELLRPLSSKLSQKLLKSWVDFNNTAISPQSFVQLIRSCQRKTRNGNSYEVSEEVCCPRGHPLIEAPNSNNIFLPACGASIEAIPCTSGPNDSGVYYRCPTCPFRYCGNCYQLRRDALVGLRNSSRSNDEDEDDDEEEEKEDSENSDRKDSKESESKSSQSIRFNHDGIPTFVAHDNVHSNTSKHYCGRYVRVDGYHRPNHLSCTSCSGTCGPNGGCQCKACAALEPTDEVEEEVVGLLSDDGWQFAEKILSLLADPERRFVLQLELLRQYPKIKTPCCSRDHCFMCKVQGHHEGRTCDEVQRDSYGVECQFCPGCGVPTVKTEGCSHIICPCGRNWQWSTESSSNIFGGAPTFNAATPAFGTLNGATTSNAPNPFGTAPTASNAPNPFGNASTNPNPFLNPTTTSNAPNPFLNASTNPNPFLNPTTTSNAPNPFSSNGNNITSFGSLGNNNNNNGGFGSFGNRNNSTVPVGNNYNLTPGFNLSSSIPNNNNNNRPNGFSSTTPQYITDLISRLSLNNNNSNNPYAGSNNPNINHNAIYPGGLGAFGQPTPFGQPFPPSQYTQYHPYSPLNGSSGLLGGHSPSLIPGYYLYSSPFGIYQIPGYLPL